MKRSQINEIIRSGDEFIRSFGYSMPPFAAWSLDQWRARQNECEEIFRSRLGWDITDYGKGEYETTGLFLFTVRNGDAADLGRGQGMLYAEKIMISKRDQLAPMHYHKIKAEDIINRGGGDLVIELYQNTPQGELNETDPVTVRCDGIARTLPPGGKIVLKPGESVTLLPPVWHAFWGEGGDVLIGEVSTVNDDETDNYFRDPIGRFPDIEEDVEPYRLMVGDYSRILGTG